MTAEDAAAWVGAITGVLGLTLSVVNFVNDRAVVRLEVLTDQHLLNAPGYSPEKTYTVLNVVNSGRRPVIIQRAGWGYRGTKGGVILADSLMGARTLGEGERTSFVAEQEGLDFGRVAFFYAEDSRGRRHKLPARRALRGRPTALRARGG